SLETTYRSLYYSKWLSRTYGVPFDYASSTDVPTYTGAYPSILASAGIKYWVAGPNSDRAPLRLREQWNRKSPFWWQGPDGSKVLFWYARAYRELVSLFGLPFQETAGYDALPVFLQPFSNPGYKPDAILVNGSQAENVELDPQTATVVLEWDRNFAYPKLQYATFDDFFRYIDQHYGDRLSTYKGDMGPFWEDGVGADALYTAEDRGNQNLALSAGVVSTVTHEVDPNLHAPAGELDDAWRDIVLYSEHTWRTAGSEMQEKSEDAARQLMVKDGFANHARFDAEDVADRAMGDLANEIHVSAGTLVVFNALNWKRDALVETDLVGHNELVDMTTGKPVTVQPIYYEQGREHVRFMASDLPPVGYKCFQIRTIAATGSGELQSDMNPVIENQYYRITVDPASGAVLSIYDKELGRELVDRRSPYRFGQYLYVTGGDGQTRIVWSHEDLPLAKLTVHPAANGQYLGAQRTPWGYDIRLQSSDINTPSVSLEILLFNFEKRIEFRYSVEKKYTTAKEGVYIAFPVQVTSPQFAYAAQQGWINPAKDIFGGGNVEWFTVQHWMAVDDASLAVGIVPVDAPLATFGDINRGEWPAEFRPKTSTIFSYAMNNYWHTNYPAGQGGKFTFRYVITSADHLDPAALTRVGWESMEPAVIDQVIRQDKIDDPDKPLPAAGTSFLEIDAPNIVLVDWKLAENGNGTILRLEETAGRKTEATIRFPHASVEAASLCNAVEDNMKPLEKSGSGIHVAFNPNQVLTVRVKFFRGGN
ncbi:MAG: glycosyl hydrolase-related protein, partial [Terriglobia bacterium]